ncbi:MULTISPECIES: GAF domain-containing protein [Vibrio]|uniref:GAF domain-containing protein n=1 Tax=Vibrio TaxID=662 RepID=UPI0001B953BF|nr:MULTISPECIES: GAF domain-containing protein [Vibrio]EEX35181.1 hypothetical protein VIC_000476 [Vibrio coralliilyticus ATCC BAA-450]MCM5510806.1 GAF domain-containing protein [Vibrio sp. SCSIO 43169]MDE3900470.1 GAF domain-containing protein [Vibrio sp. CC007]NRF65136.1 GAF domain-containing protein [Vibrio coralliilyticus]QFT37883.1 hypothetical protein FIU99_16025 [Vibrio sp. THAF64]
MPFKQLANHQQDLTAELNAIAQQFGLHSLLIMESTPETMIVFAANQQPIYNAGDAGPKSVQPGCHELYCERVVDTQSPLLVADAAADEEWRGNEDLVKFGLGVYYGLPIMHRGEAIGTVCALNDKAFDFAEGEPSAIERLNQLKLRIEQLL